MGGLACALLARPKNLFANPKKKSHRLGESAPCSAIQVPLFYTSSAMKHSSSRRPLTPIVRPRRPSHHLPPPPPARLKAGRPCGESFSLSETRSSTSEA